MLIIVSLKCSSVLLALSHWKASEDVRVRTKAVILMHVILSEKRWVLGQSGSEMEIVEKAWKSFRGEDCYETTSELWRWSSR
jgi:hypothetical protein